MKSLRTVSLLVLSIGVAMSVGGCSGPTTSGTATTEDEIVGTWIHVKGPDDTVGTGALIEFMYEEESRDPYRFRGDLGAGTYRADGSVLSMTFVEGANGEPIDDGAAARSTPYYKKNEDTLVLEDRGEFAREGSMAVEDFLESKAD